MVKRSVKGIDFSHGGVTIYSDSQSAIYLYKNHKFDECTKHVDVKLHIIRNIVS